MIELGKVADATGGTVAIVNAAMLGHRMMDLLNEAFVATHVEATLIAPKELFWYEDIELQTPLVSQHTPQRSAGTSGNGEREKISRLQKTIGNVFRSTTMICRFGIKDHIDENARIPFQVCNLIFIMTYNF